jgi:hypothetical protein
MNEYWLYFFFILTNIPLYLIIFQLMRDRQVLQDEIFCLYDQMMQQKQNERRYSDMEEGHSDDLEQETQQENEQQPNEISEYNFDEKDVKQKSD